jgi:membrane-associated phospholipid phosphatase
VTAAKARASRPTAVLRISGMRRSETIAAAYFVYLLVPVAAAMISPRRKAGLAGAALVVVALTWALGTLPRQPPWTIVRDWTPGVLLLAGYWLPGALFTSPNLAAEARLLGLDRRVFGTALEGAPFRSVPPYIRGYLELMYLFCYPLVPVALALIYRGSDPSRAAHVDSFWSTVLLSVYACYGLLPWIPTRPPRALEPAAPANGIRRLNSLVLRHASVQVNTFPSGHVAAAVAATIEVARHTAWGGAAIGIVAASIAAAAVVGRYHYLADVVLGAMVAFGAACIVHAT